MNKKKYLAILIILPLILKIILAFISPDIPNDIDYNIPAFRLMSEILLSGQNPFDMPKYVDGVLVWLGYGPIHYYLCAINGLITKITSLPYHFIIRLAPIIAETLISVLLFSILNTKYKMKSAFWWSAIYALNPASFPHLLLLGRSDTIPILFMLLSYYFFTSKNKNAKRYFVPICLAIACAFKYFFPLLITGALFFKYKGIKEKIKYASTFALTILVLYMPFILTGTLFRSIYEQVSFTPPFNWGIAKIFMLLSSINLFPSILAPIGTFLTVYGKYFLASILLITILIYYKTKNTRKYYNIMFYCFTVFTFFMHPEFLVWMIPFLFLKIDFEAIVFSILLGGHIYFLFFIERIGFALGITIEHGIIFTALSFIFGMLTWLFSIYMYYSLMSSRKIQEVDTK